MQNNELHSGESGHSGIPLAARWFMPTIGNITFLSIIYFLLSDNNSLLDDGDAGVHIRIGDLIRQTGSIPKVDPFSFTMPGHDWFAWEWLTDILMSWIHSLSGLTGIVCSACILICIVFMLLYRRMLSCGSNPFIAFFLTAFAAMISSLHWMARPHLASWIFLSVASIALESYRRSRTRWIYLLPFLVIVWANMHGSFVILFPMLAIYAIGEILGAKKSGGFKDRIVQPAKPYLLAGVLSAATSLATPNGWLLHEHIWRYLNDSSLLGIIIEFKSPDFHTTVGKMVEIIIFISMIAVVQVVKQRRWTDIGLLLLFTHLMLQSVRYIPVAAIVVFPIIGEHLSEMFKQTMNRLTDKKNGIGLFLHNWRDLLRNSLEINRKLSGCGFYILTIVILFVIMAGPLRERILDTGFNPELHPVEAAAFIEANALYGNVFSNDEYGDYLIYRFSPRIKVFIDGRSDFYNTGDVLEDYKKIANLDPAWSEILDKYDVQWLLLENKAPLGLVAQMSGGWEKAYTDRHSQILIRKQPSVNSRPPDPSK